jgi:hypothetical protein
LARLALEVKEVLRHDNFVISLGKHMASAGDEYDLSPFGFLDENLATKNRVLSVWTIRTGVEDEINYFGPHIPFLARGLSFLKNLSLVSIFCIVVMALRNGFPNNFERSMRLVTGAVWNRHGYASVSVNAEDPNAVEDSIIMGTSEVELASPSYSSYKLTTPIQRSRSRRLGSAVSSDSLQ